MPHYTCLILGRDLALQYVIMILIKAMSLMTNSLYTTPSIQLELSDSGPNAATQTNTQRLLYHADPYAPPCPLPTPPGALVAP